MMHKNEFIGQTITNWYIIEATDQRSKAGCVVFKCKNIQTNEIEYKSSAYLIQYSKRKSQKTSPGRYLETVKVNLENWEKFVNHLKTVCPNLVNGFDEKNVKTQKSVEKLFNNAKKLAAKLAKDVK